MSACQTLDAGKTRQLVPGSFFDVGFVGCNTRTCADELAATLDGVAAVAAAAMTVGETARAPTVTALTTMRGMSTIFISSASQVIFRSVV